MKKIKKHIILYLIILTSINACTTIIQVSVPNGTTQLVIDAFLDNSTKPQTVRITTSANYFSEVSCPAVLGATVGLTDLTNSKTFTFTPDGKGNYIYTPLANDTMGYVNHKYQLNVSYNGNVYNAVSTLFPTIPVDTIEFRFSAFDPTDSIPSANKTSYYPFLKAKDIKGVGNFYWIKVYKNELLYNQPDQMDFLEDANSFTKDGTDIGAPNSFGQIIDNKNPYHRGDTCLIEIYSINANTSDFLGQLQTQMTNAEAGLFAVTPQNVKTNIQQTSGNQPAIGWFNMAAVKSKNVVARY